MNKPVTSSSRVQAVVHGINVVLLSIFPQAGNKTKSAKLFFGIDANHN